MSNDKILGLDGKPYKPWKASRVERKERKFTERALFDLANKYLTFKANNTDKELIKKEYVARNRAWIGFTLKWNASPGKKTFLRITDFSNFIDNYEKNNQQKTDE